MQKPFGVMTVFVAVLLLAHIFPLAGSGEERSPVQVHHVVMHLNSGDENIQRGALNNIRHLYQEVGREHLQLELVVHGPD